MWKGIYGECAGLPDACRNCFPRSPCGGDPFAFQASIQTCPPDLIEAGCGSLGQCFFEGCNATTGKFKTGAWEGDLEACQQAPLCAGCFPQSNCSATAAEILAGTAVQDDVVCPASHYSSDNGGFGCEWHGLCFAQMSRPENRDGFKIPSLQLFDECRERAIGCVGCFPNAATALPPLLYANYSIALKGNGLVGPHEENGSHVSYDNTFCWDIPSERKDNGDFSLYEHCKDAAFCAIDGCDADGVWNVDSNSIFASCTQAPICAGWCVCRERLLIPLTVLCSLLDTTCTTTH